MREILEIRKEEEAFRKQIFPSDKSIHSDTKCYQCKNIFNEDEVKFLMNQGEGVYKGFFTPELRFICSVKCFLQYTPI